jgi:two-component system CheB/CheR fusion protein
VHTDPDLLYSVVANLVSNAVKCTRTGGVLLACRRRGGRVRIEVWDTGIGIPPDELDAIQGEYYRARNADEGGARASGFGRGLSIVSRTAALLDLRLDVRSRLGRGSVFAVELPAARRRTLTPNGRGQLMRGAVRPRWLHQRIFLA